MSELQSSLQLPVLDLAQPIQSSVLSSLSEACKEWGFFYVTNHGISKEMFNSICSLSRDVFRVPLESKLKLGPSSYTPRYIASPYFESLVVSGPDFSGSAKVSADVLFQDHHKPELRETLQEYGANMQELSKRLMKILLMMTLGDDTGKVIYQSEFSNCHGYLRLVNYTPPHDVDKQEEVVEGLGMHTDMSCITIVYQDSVGGLQMRSKEGKWIDINPCENFLVVNIGDLLQAWSNGRLRSSEHRVVLRKLLNRVSLAFFLCFEDEKVILAPEEIVGEGNCRSYKSFICSDYLKFRQSNEVGKFEKIGYTVKDFAGLKAQANETKPVFGRDPLNRLLKEKGIVLSAMQY